MDVQKKLIQHIKDVAVFLKELEKGKTTCYRCVHQSDPNLLLGFSCDVWKDKEKNISLLEYHIYREEIIDPTTFKEIIALMLNLFQCQYYVIKRFTKSHIFIIESNIKNEENIELLVKENNIVFKILPLHTSSGLFLDQRENRFFLSQLFKKKYILNCFSFTGGYGVYLAMNGAKTVQVDISKKYLNWARENFLLNDSFLSDHLFVQSDVLSYLENKKTPLFDVILLDPPSFSRGTKKKTYFSLKKDCQELFFLAQKKLKPGGRIFFNMHYKSLSSSLLQKAIETSHLHRDPDIKLPSLGKDYQHEEGIYSLILKKRGN